LRKWEGVISGVLHRVFERLDLGILRRHIGIKIVGAESDLLLLRKKGTQFFGKLSSVSQGDVEMVFQWHSLLPL